MRKGFIWLIAVAVIIIIIVRLAVMPKMGVFLVADHDLTEADAIVVLMGGPTTKVPEAADLYQDGYADLIIMAQTSHWVSELDPETGLLSAGETERSRLILIDTGVPEEAILIISSMTRSTRDEAEAVRDYLDQEQEINSIILVTSSSHARRAYLIFIRAFESLDREVAVISRASRYDDSFQAEDWWRDNLSRRRVFLEYQKIIYYYILELFNR